MGDNHGVTALSLRGWRSNRHPQHSTCSNAAVSKTGKHLFQAFVAGPSGSRTASIDESASTGWRDSGITHLAIPRASLDKVDQRRHQSIILEIHLRRNSCNKHTHTHTPACHRLNSSSSRDSSQLITDCYIFLQFIVASPNWIELIWGSTSTVLMIKLG